LSYCPTLHQDLPSFPTRRSSDLIARGVGTISLRMRINNGSPNRARNCASELLTADWLRPSWSPALVVLRSAIMASNTINRFRLRSEEHTSELQSRENLVCRLLLE